MRWIERFDLFLLDLDGLLVDTERLHFEAYKRLCQRYGHTLQWDLQQYLEMAHLSSDGLCNALQPHLQEPWPILYEEKKQIYLDLLLSGAITLMPGVEKFLQELAEHQIKRCVVTNSCRKQVSAIQKALPILKGIPVWFTREDYEKPKPAPDAYLKALELLADPGDRVIGFEDSLRGLQALQRASVPSILICDPSHPQMSLGAIAGVPHYPSFASMPNSLGKNIL